MAVVSVATTGSTLVAADVDQWRYVIIQNLDAANFVEIEVGSIPAGGAGFKIAAGVIAPALRLPANTIIGARANTAAVNVDTLIT